ncbi:MAG: hypothetical protein NVS3B25_35040 [Hymenobacter sp.]
MSKPIGTLYPIVVKGYKPQPCELRIDVLAHGEEEAMVQAMQAMRDGDYDHATDAIEFTDATADFVWEEAELDEDEPMLTAITL